MPIIETTDLFRSAYLLAQGGKLVEVRLTRQNRARAILLIGGAEVERWDRLYLSGEARINPLQFREWLNHVRDRVFERIRGPKSAT